MLRVFHQQHVVVKELKRHITSTNDQINRFLEDEVKDKNRELQLLDFSQDADMLLEFIENRKAEIKDLEDSVQRTCQEVRIDHMLIFDGAC